MDDKSRQEPVRAYFDGIGVKDVSRVPWATDAVLRTPLNPAGGENVPITGRGAIMDFFNGILPVVRGVKMLRCYIGDGGWIAGQAEIYLANGKTLNVLDAFHVENGEIIEQQNHFDTRAAAG